MFEPDIYKKYSTNTKNLQFKPEQNPIFALFKQQEERIKKLELIVEELVNQKKEETK